jgi:ADP-ribose pyrophosphatase YjhB (NUDIX family)
MARPSSVGNGSVNDPNAPAPNGMMPPVNVVVTDDSRILLIKRTDNGDWALPGGAIDIGESFVGAAVRETIEETGITCEVTGLVGIYNGPKHLIHYTSNDEVRQEFSILLTARPIAGEPTPSSESSEVHCAEPDTVGAFVIGFVLLRSEHRREADRTEDERHAPAPNVSARVELYRTIDGSRELMLHVHNASDMPIYDVELPLTTRGDAEPQTEFVGLAPPGQTLRCCPAPRDRLASHVSPEPIEIEFLDSAG